MTGYAVDPVVLRDCDAALGAAADQARASLIRVRSCVAEVSASWQGAAGSSFRDGCAQWVAGAAAMLDALDDLAALLGASGDGYVATDETVRASAR